MAAVCVYCASGPVPSRYLDLAAELGTALGSSGHTLVSGGGNVSMMGALARSTRAAGGRTVGIIPGHLVDREAADTDSDELIVTETMRERKRLMEARADGFITLPGGIGTLEELFETWTGGFLGEHDKPVVLLEIGTRTPNDAAFYSDIDMKSIAGKPGSYHRDGTPYPKHDRRT